MPITANDRALETALHSAYVISIDGSVSTDARDYHMVHRHGVHQLVERSPEPIRVSVGVTVNGRKHTVDFVQNEQRHLRLDGLESSGIASLWLSAFDLFGLRFNVTKARDAAKEIQAWLNGDGETSDVAVWVGVLAMHLDGIAAWAVHAFELKHNPFQALPLAA